MESKVQRSLRVILAIAAKDMVDAIKNKSILSQVFTLAFIIVLYRFLPSFDNWDALPRLALYDVDHSRLTAVMEDSPSFDLILTDSQQAMEAYVEDQEVVVLGLVLPSEFDRRINVGEGIALDGYFVHWASDSQISEAKTFFEEELSELAGSPIKIQTEGNIVYTIPDSRGLPFLVSLTVVLVMVISSVFIVPLLMLEEKQSKTLDALLVSPADASLVVLGKAVSGSLYCFIGAGAVLALNHNLVTQWGLVFLTACCGVLFSVGIGLWLGSVFEVKQQLTLWGFVLLNALCVPMFLSLMDDILPSAVMTVLHCLPTVALMKLFRISFSDDASIAVFGPELALVLVSVGTVLGAVVWVVRRSDR